MVKIFGFEPRRSRAKDGRFLVELRGIQRPISRRTPDPRIGFGNVKRDPAVTCSNPTICPRLE